MRDPAAGRSVVNPWSRIMSRRHILLAALCLAPALALAQMATAPFEGRLKKIQETKTISVAYRTDALPFSFEEATRSRPATPSTCAAASSA